MNDNADSRLSSPLLLAEIVQRLRILPVRNDGQLDNHGAAYLPQVREMNMGDLLLHPTHWLWNSGPHPICPECRREIFAMTPVEIEILPDGRGMVRHAECAQKSEPSDDEAI
jgi:hypothetical protein